jgi:chitinase
VDAVNGSGQAGRPEAGDTVTFTYAGVVNPDLILSGWDGSATPVTVRLDDNTNDALTVRDPSDGSALTGLGLVQLNGDYCGGTTLFTGSQMTLSGSTVTIVLGMVSGTPSRDPSAKDMVWSTPQGSATESGHPDSNF